MSYTLTNWDVETLRDNLSANETGTVISYSGRFMYGKECLGIVTDDVAKAFLLLGSGLAYGGGKSSNLLEELSSTWVRQDNLADDTVVYFPDIALPIDFVDPDDQEGE